MPSNLSQRQNRLRELAKLLESGKKLSKADCAFLAQALRAIADGDDAEAALDVKARRGERKSAKSRAATQRSKIIQEMVVHWIEVAITPEEEGGLGLTLEEAIGRIAEFRLPDPNLVQADGQPDQGGPAFGLTESTLRTYWKRSRPTRPEFTLGD